MCLFITVFVLHSSNHDLISNIAKKHQLNWIKVENSCVSKQMNSAYSIFCTTNGWCDCGTAIGSNNNSDTKEFNAAKKKQKGWSDAKIKRWLKQKESNKEVPNQTKENELQNWINFIKESLENRLTKEIGLLIHMYHKDIDSERIQLQAIDRLTDVSAEILLNVKPDRVYLFKSVNVYSFPLRTH
jgi:hypothetical protein